ncbi:transglutaminase family protein [Neotabrizicola sp. VNH66]|uniref:transglutaminase family protein n=1 Tax=Neotabrizicola sp. VNH66 TaxID=3400918 RepID=UPI003C030773
MLLSVDHVTRYVYDRPVRSLVQSHRLMPANNASQTVDSWEVTVSGGVPGAQFRDGAGDCIRGWTVAGPVSEVIVSVKGVVRTLDTAGVLRGHRETVMPEAYLRDTAATEPSAALFQLADSAEGEEILTLAHSLSAKVAAAIAYRPGATEAHTTAAEALALGEGVCQDHAHALITCARLRGIPARYVSGYLFADAEGNEHEAAHAWAELHVPGLGWIGFDAANKCCPDDRYIRIGSGFDAQDAAPIRGVARGLAQGQGTESLEVAVAVQSAGQ